MTPYAQTPGETADPQPTRYQLRQATQPTASSVHPDESIDPGRALVTILEQAIGREDALRARCLAAASGKASYSTAAVWWDLDHRLHARHLHRVVTRLGEVLTLLDQLGEHHLPAHTAPETAITSAAVVSDLRAAVSREVKDLNTRWAHRPAAGDAPATRWRIRPGWYAATGPDWRYRPRLDIVPASSLQRLRQLT